MAVDWRRYLGSYHDSHPGITEDLLRRCTPDPYAWLLDGVDVTGLRVLDLACGSAPLNPDLTGARYLGVDASPSELQAAVAGDRGPVVRADALRLPLSDGSVDLVVCSMALQILTPLPQVLAELRRVLTPTGRVLAMLPVSSPLTATDRIRYARILWRLRRPRLGYANNAVARRMAQAGWTVTAQHPQRVAYPLSSPEDAHRLVNGFYLPATSNERRAAASKLASAWTGSSLGIPLMRLVAQPSPAVSRPDRLSALQRRPPRADGGGASTRMTT